MAIDSIEAKILATGAAQERALTRAAGAGQSKRISLLAELVELNRYPVGDPLQTEESVLMGLARRAEQKETDDFLRNIILGKNNDHESRRPGLVAVVHEAVKQKVEEMFNRKNDSAVDASRPHFEFFEIASVGNSYRTLYEMQLLHGGFADRGAHLGIMFTDITVPDGFERVKATVADSTSFTAELDQVLNIVDSGGAYWQNPDSLVNLPDNIRYFLDV